MIATCPLFFMSSSPFTNPLGIVQSAPIKIIIIIIIITIEFFTSVLAGGLSLKS